MIKKTFAKIFALSVSASIFTATIFLVCYFLTHDTSILFTEETGVILICAILAIILACILIAYFVSKSIIRPIVKILEDLDDTDGQAKYKELQPFVDTIIAQQKKQKLLDKQKKQFTANVSHELKTPLTAIAGYAELIETGLAKPEDIKPFAHTIRKQALRLVSLAEDIIQLSQLEETENEIIFEEVDLSKVATTCVEALSMNAQMRNIEFNLDADKKCFIKGNASIVEELIYNLCDNAIRYNKDNGTVNISVKGVDKSVLLTVSDTGIGIPEKYQNRIFERFFRVDKSRSKETGGTGLGLAIVKHIAEVHNAKLTLQSKENIGTTISVEFESI